MSIEVSHITKLFGEQRALDDVSFQIPTGKIVGFLGPNGAGKSTMMKIITGFIPPTRGQVLVNGMDVVTEALAIRKEIGYLPENNPLYPEMYVQEYLQFVGGIYNIPHRILKEKIQDAIHLTGLTHEKSKKIRALSKGYRQRVGLAQAILHDPGVLILDEPTSGLDPNQIIEIRAFISELGKKKTVLLSTHIMQEVEAICDHIIIINQGKIVADQSTGTLTTSRKVFQVEFDRELSENLIQTIPGVEKSVMLKDHQWLIQADPGPLDIRPLVFDFAVKHGFRVLSISEKGKNLENVFRELTLGNQEPKPTI